jgi:hypothetical protein
MQAAHDADHADEMTRRLHEDMAKPATAIPEVYAVKAPEKECVSWELSNNSLAAVAFSVCFVLIWGLLVML